MEGAWEERQVLVGGVLLETIATRRVGPVTAYLYTNHRSDLPPGVMCGLRVDGGDGQDLHPDAAAARAALALECRSRAAALVAMAEVLEFGNEEARVAGRVV